MNYIDKMEVLFKALSDSTRLKIIITLIEQELCVGDLAVKLDMTDSAISHQLSYLRKIDILKSRRDGKHIIYSVIDDCVEGMVDTARKHVRGN